MKNGQREEKKHSNTKEPYKSGKTTTTTTTKPKQTDSLRTDSLVKEDLSKVPKRSAHNGKQSY